MTPNGNAEEGTDMKVQVKNQKNYLLIEDGHLYYEVYGTGVPIILFHGNGESHRKLIPYARKLEKEGFQVILMDSRGHGRSELNLRAFCKKMSAKDMAQDTFLLIKELKLKKVILFGFSDGANTALQFAADYPEYTQSVIAISPNARPDGLLLPVRLWVNIAYNVDDYICKRLHAKRKAEGMLARLIQKRRFYYSLLLHSPQLTQEKLKSITCPVLILAGTKDLIKKEHIRWMNRQIPRCQTVFIKGAVHLDFYRKIEWYYPFIRRFLKCQCVL